MVPLFLALAVLAQPAPTTSSAQASAMANVRIVAGARVTLGRTSDHGSFIVTRASIRTEDGQRRRAQLVEFQ